MKVLKCQLQFLTYFPRRLSRPGDFLVLIWFRNCLTLPMSISLNEKTLFGFLRYWVELTLDLPMLVAKFFPILAKWWLKVSEISVAFVITFLLSKLILLILPNLLCLRDVSSFISFQVFLGSYFHISFGLSKWDASSKFIKFKSRIKWVSLKCLKSLLIIGLLPSPHLG